MAFISCYLAKNYSNNVSIYQIYSFLNTHAEVSSLCNSFHNIFEISYRLAVLFLFFQRKRLNTQPVIEQLGSYDPMPNNNNEKLVALNLERIKFWLGQGAHVTTPVAELLGKFKFVNLILI